MKFEPMPSSAQRTTEQVPEKLWAEVFVDLCMRLNAELQQNGINSTALVKQKEFIRNYLLHTLKQTSKGLHFLELAARMQLYGPQEATPLIDEVRAKKLAEHRQLAEVIFYTIAEVRHDVRIQENREKDARQDMIHQAKEYCISLYETMQRDDNFLNQTRADLEKIVKEGISKNQFSKIELEEMYFMIGERLEKAMPRLKEPNNLYKDTKERVNAFIERGLLEGLSLEENKEQSSMVTKKTELILAFASVIREQMKTLRPN
jgi:murein L,D-transpeptidase YcbB/YkuD